MKSTVRDAKWTFKVVCKECGGALGPGSLCSFGCKFDNTPEPRPLVLHRYQWMGAEGEFTTQDDAKKAVYRWLKKNK